MKRSAQVLILFGLVATSFGCANRPCRDLRHPELAAQQASGASAVAATASDGVSAGASTPDKTTAPSSTTAKNATVLVFKPDGSLQCKSAKGMSASEMEKQQLSGIKVFSSDKRPDGLMHIQVCGAPTGIINIFEISSTSLKDAEARGFKKLEPR